MKILYSDGGVLECEEIEIGCGELLADDIYTVPLDEIERIVSD